MAINFNDFHKLYTNIPYQAPNPSFSDRLGRFCKAYDAKATITKRDYARSGYETDFFNDPYRADIMQQRYYQNRVPIVELDIPADALERVLANDEKIRERQVDFDWIDRMRDKEDLESRIRASNETVKKAYEKYSMLLNMVKDSYK